MSNDIHETHLRHFPEERMAPKWLLDRYQARALVVFGLGTIALIIGAFVGANALDHFFRAYLAGFVLWTGASLGCMALLMVNHLSAGKWGLIIRRILEAGCAQFPLLFILWLPIGLGMNHLFPWTHPRYDMLPWDAQRIINNKAWVYLNPTFFWLRWPFYFFMWWWFSSTLRKWSIQRDEDPTKWDYQRHLENRSGVGLVMYALTMTFAIIDWVMSLDATWFSTIYGLIFLSGQGMMALAISIMTVLLLSGEEPMRSMLRKTELHDLGKLMLAFVMLYAYTSFSQWLIIWSGNLPQEINWYMNRLAGGWMNYSRFLILVEFAIPFALLLSRRLKKQPGFMVPFCVGIIVVRMLDIYWEVEPSFLSHENQWSFNWMYLASTCAIGGLWAFFFIRSLKSRPILVSYDLQLEELLEPEHATA